MRFLCLSFKLWMEWDLQIVSRNAGEISLRFGQESWVPGCNASKKLFLASYLKDDEVRAFLDCKLVKLKPEVRLATFGILISLITRGHFPFHYPVGSGFSRFTPGINCLNLQWSERAARERVWEWEQQTLEANRNQPALRLLITTKTKLSLLHLIKLMLEWSKSISGAGNICFAKKFLSEG